MAPDGSNDDVSIDLVNVSNSEAVSARLKSPTKVKSQTPVKQIKQSSKQKSDSKHTELVRDLIDRAGQISDIRKDIQTPKSEEELKVEKFSNYMNVEVQKINCKLWFDFTMDYQRLVSVSQVLTMSQSLLDN